MLWVCGWLPSPYTPYPSLAAPERVLGDGLEVLTSRFFQIFVVSFIVVF